MRICKPFASPFQSTCPARGTTLLLCLYYTLQCRISIHVPREGHDQDSGGNSGGFFGFQSTCPARGTTRGAAFPQRVRRISIHVPREGHDVLAAGCHIKIRISIHVPREGHDEATPARPSLSECISIHVPREGHDRGGICLKCQGRGISIHVPREGHDPHPQRLLPVKNHFNPRAPRGARLYLSKSVAYRKLFQSTCPARGTTGRGRLWRADRKSISIHVPREGHDVSVSALLLRPVIISIHVPREGHDARRGRDVPGAQPYFNPRAPRGARRKKSRHIKHL